MRLLGRREPCRVVVPSFEQIAGGGVRVAPQFRKLKPADLLLLVQRGLAVVSTKGVVVPAISGGSRQYWEEAVAWATADGAAIASSTTETIVFPNFTVPGGYMADGRVLKLSAFGRHSSTGTPTVTFRVRWGGVAGTVLCASGAITVGSAIANAMWKVDVLLQTRTNGATGTIFGVGQATSGEDAASTTGSATNTAGSDLMGSAGVAAPAVSASIDLTIDQALSLTAQWGTNSASNTLTGHVYVIESLN